MSDIISKCYHKIFHTDIARNLPKTYAQMADTDVPIKVDRMVASVVLMSFATLRELERADIYDSTGLWSENHAKGKPRRIFGVRIAIDDSLPLGEFLIAENLT